MVGAVGTEDREEGAPALRPRNRTHHRTDVGLAVATLAFRQRPSGVGAEELASPVECSLIYDGEIVARCPILDVAAEMLGILVAPEVPMWKGMRFDQVRIEQRHRTVAEGAATVVEVEGGAERRAELRFAGGELDLGTLRLRDGAPLDPGGATPETAALPADWRAAVAELGQILRWSAEYLDVTARSMGGSLTPSQEQEIFGGLFTQWAPRCLGSLARLHDLSVVFEPEQRAAAAEHARAQLLGEAIPGRIVEAPAHGSVDDHALPYLFQDAAREGSTRPERFFRHAWAHFPLVRTILARPRWLAELWDGLRGRPRSRVLVLQPGGAAELGEVQLLGGARVELTILEADPEVREARQSQWRERWPGRSADLHIESRPPEGLPELGEEPYDLVYGAGVLGGMDDEHARALVERLHASLAPRGRLVLGNLQVEPASTWLLDYVLGWRVHYREVQALGGMVEELGLAADSWQVGADPTGRTSVLDLVR